MRPDLDVVCLGEALVDLVALRAGVGLDRAPGFRTAAGGAPANVAVGVARLGRRAAFVGTVGGDPFGTFLRATLGRHGVDCTSVSTAADRQTALALVARRADGSPDFLFYGDRPAHLALRLDRAARRTIRRARVFHFGSLSLAGEPARRATLAALAEAERAGRFRSYDPNLRLGLWPDAGTARRWLLAGLRHADCVKVNEDELRFLTGEADVGRGLARLTAAGPVLAVATLGARGCAYHGPGGTGQVRGFRARVVDTTGAGDAFVAGLLVGLLGAGGDPAETLGDRARLEAALAFANAVAALCTERMGGIPSLPSRRRVCARLRPRLIGASREVARQAPDGSS